MDNIGVTTTRVDSLSVIKKNVKFVDCMAGVHKRQM